MKTTQTKIRMALLLVLGLTAARAANADDYLNPPGAVWGVLGDLRTRGIAIAALPDGYIVTGEEWTELTPSGGCPDLCYWATLARLNLNGAVVVATNFHWVGWHTEANRVMPVFAAGGNLEGFILAGAKSYLIEEDGRVWGGPGVWLVKTDPNLVTQWDTLVIKVAQYCHARALALHGAGFVMGGSDGFLIAADPLPREWAWLGGFDATGNFTGTLTNQYAMPAIYAIEPAGDGGYVLGTEDGLIKVNSALAIEWQAGNGCTSFGCRPDAYRGVRRTPAGDFVAVGRRPLASSTSPDPPDWGYGELVLSKFTAGGELVWSRVYGDGGYSTEVGNDLALSPDGSIIIVGTTDSRGHGSSDLWVLKTDANGEMDSANEWELCLGGAGADYGNAIAIAPDDGNYMVAGTAKVDGTNRLWVVKVRNNLHSPVPAFTFTPASPVFRDQPITFDASSSTAPGSTIVSYDWSFGDGTNGVGVTATHAYRRSGIYPVTLTVENADGVVRSVTQDVEIIGLKLQWERFFGRDDQDAASSLVAADNEGFILTGSVNADLWLLKTDRRGKRLWEKFINNGFGGTQEGRAIIRAHEPGYYMVAGYDFHYTTYWYEDAWLLKVDEDGELAWPIKVFGEPNRNEVVSWMAPVEDGGYILAGRAPTNSVQMAWLLKIDGAGNREWESHFKFTFATTGEAVTPTADGGFVLLASENGMPHRLIKTDARGVPVWTNQMRLNDDWRWIGPREPPNSGCVLVGESGENICMKFLDPEGRVESTKSWTGMTSRQENDVGNNAARTPDGGYLIVGSVSLLPSLRDDLALVKTDAEGNTHWIEFLPGTTNINEEGLAAVALTNNSYVILGRRETGDSRIWLFKLAYNHPPVPRMQCSTNVTTVDAPISFDGSLSTDRENTVFLHEWDFGDGATATGPGVAHAYTNAGIYTVRLTAVDADDAERSVTNSVVVAGVKLVNLQNFNVLGSSITNCPLCDPTTYPRTGTPLRVDWSQAWGVTLLGTATSSTTRTIRITFSDPVPAGMTLYLMPAWTVVSYTLVDPYTIEVQRWVASGQVSLAFVLAATAPLPSITSIRLPNASRLLLTFSTSAGFQYRVQRTPQITSPTWTDVPYALAMGDPVTLDAVDGTGAGASVFVEKPADGSAFFRVTMEAATR